jgi:hypothetical protein
MPNKKIIPETLLRLSGLIGLLCILSTACQHDPVGVDAQPLVCFKTDVLPVIQSNCGKSGCHAGENGESRRLNLSTAAGILENISPRQPLSSNVFTSIIDGSMPPAPNSPLTKAQRSAIYLWILQGADTSCVTK